jgi:hypothetical protein
MNKEVSFELAKLLKEKEYHENCWQCYRIIKATEDRLSWWKIGELNKPMYCTFSDKNDAYYGICSAPTIADVVMWIYEKYGIWIAVFRCKDFMFDIIIKDTVVHSELNFNSPTEAYEAGIKYCLEKIIYYE